MRSRIAPAFWLRAAAVIGAVTLSLAACGGTVDGGGAGAGAAETASRVQVMAPADPGGGWDSTARAMAQSMEDAKLARSTTVTNVPGAGGTVGLAQLANEQSEDYLMVMGLVMIGAIQTSDSPTTLQDVTPIAQLTAEDEIVVVPAESPYRTIEDLGKDLAERGRKVSIAGGSAGGTDHILAGLIAKEAGADPSDLNYIAFSGGGESLAALLGNKVAAGISGVSEYADLVASGKLRALAVSGPERVEGIDAPTLSEAGFDIELRNWRGVVAPKGISAEAKERLETLVTEMHDSPAWREALETNGWTDTFRTGEEFERFIREEEKTTASVLADLGLISG